MFVEINVIICLCEWRRIYNVWIDMQVIEITQFICPFVFFMAKQTVGYLNDELLTDFYTKFFFEIFKEVWMRVKGPMFDFSNNFQFIFIQSGPIRHLF